MDNLHEYNYLSTLFSVISLCNLKFMRKKEEDNNNNRRFTLFKTINYYYIEMLNYCTNILYNSISLNNKVGLNNFALEFVRWRRKPRWLPVAESKIFRVPERKPQTIEERNELLRLYNQYRTQFRSIRHYLIAENARKAETSSIGHFKMTPEEEEQDFQASMDANAKWNEEVKAIREARLNKLYEEMKIYVEERKRKIIEEKEKKMAEIEKLVKIQKEESKDFITRENLQQAIECALANPVDHNFALDLEGNIYKGRLNNAETKNIANKQPLLEVIQQVN